MPWVCKEMSLLNMKFSNITNVIICIVCLYMSQNVLMYGCGLVSGDLIVYSKRICAKWKYHSSLPKRLNKIIAFIVKNESKSFVT